MWKRRFPALHLGLRSSLTNSLVHIVAAAVLYNICIIWRQPVINDSDEEDNSDEDGGNDDSDDDDNNNDNLGPRPQATGAARRAAVVANHFAQRHA